MKSFYFCYLNELFVAVLTARIEDGDEVDNWTTIEHRTGVPMPLRADRWFQRHPISDPEVKSSNYSGIQINIWNRAKIRRFLRHTLVGSGSHNLGYDALRWEMILNGNAGQLGKYAVISVLPDKIARFLYEYHDTSYSSLGLSLLPVDRSNISVHGILQPQQVILIL